MLLTVSTYQNQHYMNKKKYLTKIRNKIKAKINVLMLKEKIE
jgi:hypothetical protein